MKRLCLNHIWYLDLGKREAYNRKVSNDMIRPHICGYAIINRWNDYHMKGLN